MPRTAENPSVTSRLRNDILHGDLTPGMRLIELQLTDRYQVGRAAIRSAIVELGKEGLVTHEANRGATVRSLNLPEIIEVYEARSALEGLAAGYAATLATAEERDELRSLASRMRDSANDGNSTALKELGHELHDRISRMGRHRIARGLIAALLNRSRQFRDPERASMQSERVGQVLTEHLAIIDAIIQGNSDEAKCAIHHHIDSTIASLREEVLR
jgi:DNA-binding GntR family transcriptional regulator